MLRLNGHRYDLLAGTNEPGYRSILLDPASPWRKYPWDPYLGGDRVTANPAKSAELTLAVHPQGLMCVRVRAPDHIDAEDHAYRLELQC